MQILVIAGHPADMFDHCGGTLLHHIQQGDSVVCTAITQGLRIHDEVIYDKFRNGFTDMTEEEIQKLIAERQKVKYAEAVSACKLFGIEDIRFLDYDDEILCVTPEMVSKVAKLIRDVKPDLVITHWPYQDDTFSNHHAVTGQLALAGITAAHGVSFENGQASWNVAQVAYMICPADYRSGCLSNKGRSAYINYYVDVSDVVELKVRAVNEMASQKYDIEGYAQKTTEMWNGNLGARMRVPYAEGFAIEYPELGRVIPVSEHRMWLAHGDEREQLEAISNCDAMKVKL